MLVSEYAQWDMVLSIVYSTWYCCASVLMCELLDLAIDACASSRDARNTTGFLCDEYRLNCLLVLLFVNCRQTMKGVKATRATGTSTR